MKIGRTHRIILGITLPLSLSLASCDWIPYAFMNSIPFHGDSAKNPDVYVYLGVDGLSYFTTQDAIKDGSFSDPQWRLAKFVTGFPGTSDASWTRIMHTEELGGYEFAYYDPTKDTILNRGLVGILEHVAPSLSSSINFEPEYLRGFDYWANGYSHVINAYNDTFVSYADSVGNLFSLLEGRAETATVFTAYLVEIDVMGHLQASTDVSKALSYLAKKIEEFKRNHPERNFHFTLFSDHGLDFIPVEKDRLVKFESELQKVGVTPVDSIKSHNPSAELFAIPVVHTRVTYMALHTHPDLIEKIAEKTSLIPSVDLAVAHLKQGPTTAEWFGIWKDGKLAASFGFDANRDLYFIPSDAHFEEVGLNADFGGSSGLRTATDQELFQQTKNSTYPDLFYRIRTSLSPVGCKFPADVLASLKPSYVSMGFQIMDADTLTAHSGFHGSLEYRGTLGTLLTEEKEIPDAVRSDTLLDLFPRLKNHLRDRSVHFVEGDKNAATE